MTGNTPVFLAITDIRPYAGELTDPVKATRYLQKFGVDVVQKKAALVRLIDDFARW